MSIASCVVSCPFAALATEAPTPDLLKEKPHGRGEPLISRYMWRFIFTQGIYQVGWVASRVLVWRVYDVGRGWR